MTHSLNTTIQSSGKKSVSTEKRKVNIAWIEELSRDGLKFKERERQVHFKKTKVHEDIYIQYPGKESIRPDEKKRPWDFIPKIYLNQKGLYSKDLSFANIWGTFIDELEPIRNKIEDQIRSLAVLFYRMAFMLDHRPDVQFKTQTKDISFNDDTGTISHETEQKFPNTIYLYSPPTEVIAELEKSLPKLGDISIEAFLYYNELLAWNEDCKYYYREQLKGTEKWIGDIGRINNLLSHVSILGAILGDIKFADIMGRLQRGVVKATNKELISICKGAIDK